MQTALYQVDRKRFSPTINRHVACFADTPSNGSPLSRSVNIMSQRSPAWFSDDADSIGDLRCDETIGMNASATIAQPSCCRTRLSSLYRCRCMAGICSSKPDLKFAYIFAYRLSNFSGRRTESIQSKKMQTPCMDSHTALSTDARAI